MQYSDLLGTPFKLYGRDKTGIDCLGVVLEVYRRAGTPFPDPLEVLPTTPSLDAMLSTGETSEWSQVVGGYRERDVVLFRDSAGSLHVGVLVTPSRILHATEAHGVVVSPLRYKQQSIEKVYRYRCQD